MARIFSLVLILLIILHQIDSQPLTYFDRLDETTRATTSKCPFYVFSVQTRTDSTVSQAFWGAVLKKSFSEKKLKFFFMARN